MNKLVESLEFKDIHWKVQECNSESILFYKLNDSDPNSYKNFLKNIENTDFFHLFVCTSIKYEEEKNISFVDFKEWAKIQEKLCNKIYGEIKSSKLVAITGTNGKTTTVDFIRQICVKQKISVLSIGTLGVWYNDKKEDDFGLTTPNYIDLRKYINKYKADVIVFEASSHAIEQKRFLNLEIDTAAWTSFSQDHLDYHKTMESYYKAKLGLRDSLKENGKMFFHHLDSNQHKESDQFIKSNLDIQAEKEFLKVSYNKKNLDLAVCCLEQLKIKRLEDYEFLSPAPGRFNVFKFEESMFIVDYAHTPDAIENICKEIKRSYNKKVITLFGCGGNRDKTKRPLMGIAACSNSDEVIITTDNPRFENPEEILKDITDGLSDYDNYKVIKNREDAIRSACKNKKSIVLILGKGHEPYMDIMGEKIHYSDIELVERIINE